MSESPSPSALADEVRSLEIINETGQVLASGLDLETIVQAAVDAGVNLTGAQFGAFFYNHIGDDGEKYLLYTLSGAPRSAFESYPSPRATPVFKPTFLGEGVIRSGDITQDPRYGQMAPYHGMPPDHLPVRSYLAIPVISRSGEVLGGLFFGHSEPARFEARHERVMTAIAAQGAVAIDNARLHQATQDELRRRKATEAALAESQAFLRLVLDSASTGVCAIDGHGVTTMCNRAFLTLLGVAGEDGVLGRPVHEVVRLARPDGSPYGFADSPVQPALEQGLSSHIADATLHRWDGSPVPVELWMEPLVAGEERRGALCSFNDVTERKAAQAALSRFNADLAAQVQARTAERDRMWQLSAEVMLVSDRTGKIVALNPAAETVMGWTRADIGRTSTDFLHPDDYQVALEAFGRLEAGDKTTHFVTRQLHKDGEYRVIAWNAVPHEGFIHAVGRDITAERTAAEALKRTEDALRQSQKMEAVGQLTGGIAHDFNNMLAIIIGSLDLAGRRLERGQDGVQHYLDGAKEGASRAAALTQRLLAFSRQQPLAPEVLHLNKMTADMSELLRRTLGETVILETVLAGGLWLTKADPHQLESALINLAVNARDAMPEGGKLTLETANCYLDDDYVAEEVGVVAGQYVMIAVSDAGEGISPEILGKVFDPFFTTKPVGKGTGLGLSMVYGFVKQTGGHVRIYSELGQGTVIKIYLPRHVGFVGEEGTGPVRRMGLASAAGAEVVLVVEDDDRVRQMSVEALKELGYVVHQAASGAEALRLAVSVDRLDLLFTDVVMPGMTGRQLSDALAARLPEVKVLYTTGYTRNAVVHNGVLDADVSLLVKPFTIADLAAKVRAVLDA
jgi:PAS domain S-box-containing protein